MPKPRQPEEETRGEELNRNLDNPSENTVNFVYEITINMVKQEVQL